MKTIKLFAAVLLATVASMSFASTTSVNSTNAALAKKEILKIITSEVTFPQVRSFDVFDYEGEVLVSVGFDENDQLVITQLNATNDLLKVHVAKQLRDLVILNAKKSLNGELLNFKFVFRKHK